MTLKKTVESLTHQAVSTAATTAGTAVTAVRHPFGTAAKVTGKATGLVKGTAGAGIGLVRSRVGGTPTQSPTSDQSSEGVVAEVKDTAADVAARTADVVEDVKTKSADTAQDVKAKSADTAQDVKAKSADTAQDVKAKSADTAQDVQAKTADTVEDVQAKAADTVEDVKTKTADTLDETAAKLDKAAPATKKPRAAKPAKKAAAKKAPTTTAAPAEDPRDEIPGPDLAAFPPPAPEDLPEPIVIEAEPAEPAEQFHNEPKPATRTSAHGGTGDREETSGFVEEIVTTDTDVETPVGTTGAGVGHNPSTAESDLQQPGTPAVLDPSVVKAVESESEILRKAADPKKG